jgi:hypothetical protein
VTVWRWGASNIPALSAFFPAVTKTAATWQQYKQNLTGQPGTRAIPAPNLSNPSSPLLVGADHRSSDAPPWWYPQLWYEDTLPGLPFPAGGNSAGMQIYSDNQIPIPSIDPTRGTYRYGGGQVVPAYQNTYRRAVTQRTVQVRYG